LTTNSSGALQASYTYDPYGNLLASSGTAANPFGYAGQYVDGESGLIYLRARYHDPATAQFLGRDLLPSRANPYGYVHQNPLNSSDPSGLYDNSSTIPIPPLWSLPILSLPSNWAPPPTNMCTVNGDSGTQGPAISTTPPEEQEPSQMCLFVNAEGECESPEPEEEPRQINPWSQPLRVPSFFGTPYLELEVP